jgi:hypothetical protein
LSTFFFCFVYWRSKKQTNDGKSRQSAMPDGQEWFFPFEMERTTSLHYTVSILNAIFIAQLSDKTDKKFYSLQTKSDKSRSDGV